MNQELVKAILKNDKPVRTVLEQFSVSEADVSVDLGSETNDDVADSDQPQFTVDPDEKFRHLFVRRFKANDLEKPVKRARVANAAEAINLYYQWIDQFKHDGVEIWTDVAADAKQFYRFCLVNRDQIEQLWKSSARQRKQGILFTSAYRDLLARSRQSGNNVVGTLEPFSVKAD